MLYVHQNCAVHEFHQEDFLVPFRERGLREYQPVKAQHASGSDFVQREEGGAPVLRASNARRNEVFIHSNCSKCSCLHLKSLLYYVLEVQSCMLLGSV